MTSTFTLYGSPHSQFTYKVGLMLRLSNQPFNFRYVSFQKGMHRTPEFLALSRWGQVPVLVHGTRTLVQSGVILEYLADTLGTFGGNGASRLAVREWLFWDADRLAPPAYGCYGVRLGELNLLPSPSIPSLLPTIATVSKPRWERSKTGLPKATFWSATARVSRTSAAMAIRPRCDAGIFRVGFGGTGSTGASVG